MDNNVYINAATQMWLSIVKDIIIGFAAIITSIAAIRGLNTWRKQLIGASKYDIAKRLKKSVFKVRHSIDAFRSRFFTSLESEIEKDKDNNFQRQLDKVIENSYKKRWRVLNNSMIEFEENQLDAEVAIGDEITTIGNRFRFLVRELESNLEVYIAMRSWDKLDRNDETFKSARSIIVSGIEGEKDAYKENLDKIASDYKTILDKYIGIKK